MEENCLDKSCLKEGKKAKYSCSCDHNLRFCTDHMFQHLKIPGVHHQIKISEAIMELKTKAAIVLENLDNNEEKLLNTGMLMTKEIITKVQETMMNLESRKIEIIKLLESRKFGVEINAKIEEFAKINFQHKGGFQESVEKYLSLYENHENSIFKEEIIAIHKGIEASNIIFQGINEVRIKESENFNRKLDNLEQRMNENINTIKDDIKNNKLSKEIESIKYCEKIINKEIQKIKQDIAERFKLQKQECNGINQAIISKAAEESLKIKQMFESLENKFNDSMIKMQKDLLMKNDEENKNMLIKLSKEIANSENKINLQFNSIKQEFLDRIEMQAKEYNEKSQMIINSIERGLGFENEIVQNELQCPLTDDGVEIIEFTRQNEC